MFEWDESKNRANIAKHGIGFDRARRIFDGYVLSGVDSRFDYGEERIISIGRIAEDQIVVLTLVHTSRNGRVRIISARKASKRERQFYEEALQKRTQP